MTLLRAYGCVCLNPCCWWFATCWCLLRQRTCEFKREQDGIAGLALGLHNLLESELSEVGYTIRSQGHRRTSTQVLISDTLKNN